jgi:quinoprotein glucose dehydrogenase
MSHLLLAFHVSVFAATGGPTADWPTYGNDPGGMRYSPLTQIDRDNVTKLRVAWTYHTGDVADGSQTPVRSAFEATPIVVDHTMYFSTPFDRVIALDPETGRERWTYDPKIDRALPYGDGYVSRGVATWIDSKAHQRRIFIATLDGRLIALNAANGKTFPGFGRGGQVDLKEGIARLAEADPGAYHMTSPPAVIGNLVVVGSSINDNGRSDMPSGTVRAYDARTGQLKWSWDPIPKDLPSGAANAWSILSVDPVRGLVFVPTGAASPDYFGGLRPGDNRDANSVVALQGSTGRRVWGFQVVHHDLWDYDVAAQPTLFDLSRDGKAVPALLVATKMGNLFVLNRETGEPLFPVEERPVPNSDVPGEQASRTQPFPTVLPALVPQKLGPDDAFGATPDERKWCRDRMEKLRTGPIFTPASLQGTVVFPGNVGGVNWGGVSYDPKRTTVVAATNRLAFVVTLIPREKARDAQRENPNAEWWPMKNTPFALRREPLVTPNLGVCNPPPWGALSAIDLSSGKLRWEVPLGTMPEASNVPGAERLGSLNLGGPITTASGLIFIGAARDNFLRAFDIGTGKELWKGELPASPQATPMTYQLVAGGKQYVVIAAGGHGKLKTKLGDTLVAFALP